MATFTIDDKNLRDLDGFLEVENPDGYDEEIENIVNNLWQGIGEYESLLLPLFTISLQSDLLRPLYIQYLTLRELGSHYDRIVVNASTVNLDIVAKHLGFELSPDRSFHDKELFLIRHYDFSEAGRRRRPGWKRSLSSLVDGFVRTLCDFRGIDVLYLNAGKLANDLARIPRSMSARRIPLCRSARLGCDVASIEAQVRENIQSMNLSIPRELVLELVERRMLVYLSDVVNRIGVLAEFIEKYGVKLVIASAVTHEDHLCLLAAAKLTGTDSLIVSHGFTLAVNRFLDHYGVHQATLSDIEPRYEGAAQFPLKASWFERKV